jgi:hypothetical protein
VLQDCGTPLHFAARHLEVAQFLVEQCGADVHAKDSEQRTALDHCTIDVHARTAVFLRRCMEPKPKMFALCMGMHCRLGVDSPLKVLNVDVMQEIAKHLSL